MQKSISEVQTEILKQVSEKQVNLENNLTNAQMQAEKNIIKSQIKAQNKLFDSQAKAIEKILDSNNAYQGAALKEMQSFLKLYDRHLQSLSVFYAVASLKASAQIEEVFKMDQKYAKGASGMEEK